MRIRSRASEAGWRFPRVGYALALDGRSGFARVAPSSVYAETAPTSFVLMSQSGRQRPDLLWCVHEPQAVVANRGMGYVFGH